MFWAWAQALSQEHLSTELRVAPGTRARIVARPGPWMDQTQADLLLADIRSVATRALPDQPLDYGVLSGARDRLKNSILTVLYDEESGEPVAFNALAIMDVQLHGRSIEVVHLGLVMIAPGVRNRGFSWALYGLTCILLLVRRQLRPMWLSNVTQVPAIIGLVCDGFTNVYPNPETNNRCSFEHLLIAREIMAKHRSVFGVGDDAQFDEESFVIANAYTGGSDNLKKTFDESPKHRDAVFNDFCHEKLNYGRGDDFLQLCQLDLDVMKRFVLKDVPRRSLPALLTTLAIVSLNRLVLPLVYWFSVNRPWGILRPAHERAGGGR
ncbi:MAG: hypothetical protein AAGB04_25465 [Pseudomonadota bacterium]